MLTISAAEARTMTKMSIDVEAEEFCRLIEDQIHRATKFGKYSTDWLCLYELSKPALKKILRLLEDDNDFYVEVEDDDDENFVLNFNKLPDIIDKDTINMRISWDKNSCGMYIG